MSDIIYNKGPLLLVLDLPQFSLPRNADQAFTTARFSGIFINYASKKPHVNTNLLFPSFNRKMSKANHLCIH